MKGTKQYRFPNSPKEKEFHDKFVEMFINQPHILSHILFGHNEKYPTFPKRNITAEEETICCNLIQWLGSTVGQSLLADCGFENVETITTNIILKNTSRIVK